MQLDNSVKPSEDNSMFELKKTVSEALIKKGIYGKMQSELKASIFSIFKEKEMKLSFMSQIQRVNELKSTVEGQLMFNLILEACDILGLNFSKSVLLSEASLMDVAVSQNALRNQLNLEGEGEQNTPVLLQLLKTLNVQDINLEDFIIDKKHRHIDSFEAFKQKQLNNNSEEDVSTSNKDSVPIIMTSEMKTEKTIDDFKNRNKDILKKLDSIISLDKDSNNDNNLSKNEFEEEYGEEFEGDEADYLIEEVSLIDIQNNSHISNEEIMKESKIIDEAEAEAVAKSLQKNKENNNKDQDESVLDNKYKEENDSEIEFVTEISKDEEENNDTANSLSEELGDDSEHLSDYPLSNKIDDPSELRKQATKSLIDDIKFQLENEVIEKPSSTDNDIADDQETVEIQKQISIDDINVNKNIR